MKQIRLILTIGISVLLYMNAHAVTFLTEQFSGYLDGRLGDTGIGGGGTVPGWNTADDRVTISNAWGNLDAEALGLVSSLGAKVVIANTNTYATNAYDGTYNKWIAQNTFPPANETNLYYSFLYKFNDVSQLPSDGSAFYIIGCNRQNSGVTSLTTYHWFLFAKNAGGSGQVGICKYDVVGNAYGATNWCTTNLASGQTFLVVLRQYITPTAAVPDTNYLWINPATNTFGLPDGSWPTPSASTSDGTDDTSGSGPGRFHVLCTPASAELDELRIGSTWADVTIPKGTCVSASSTLTSTNAITQVEQISATFTASAGPTTSPGFQWQLSKDGGTTWNNILNATAPNYTTPNLFIATDQGNKYRAIVAAGCNSSTATSAVVTVTLTVPTVTANGVIMHDQFTDTVRDLPPVTQSNSVWFTAATISAYLDAFTGDLIGTPRPGSSSLWLGFFTETNALPVHLGISNKITVTLPFTTGYMNSFTNNGALRFGLFDYYDGGVRPTADASTLTGSGGQATGVRGYMLSVDWGTNFTANSPLSLLVRNGLGDANLMGTTGDLRVHGQRTGGRRLHRCSVVCAQHILHSGVLRAANRDQLGERDGDDYRARNKLVVHGYGNQPGLSPVRFVRHPAQFARDFGGCFHLP